MALHFPPAGTVAWGRYVQEVKIQHRVDIQRLWQVIPQIPDQQAGIPFTGPSDPDRPSSPPSVSSRSSSSRSSGSSGSSSNGSSASSSIPGSSPPSGSCTGTCIVFWDGAAWADQDDCIPPCVCGGYDPSPGFFGEARFGTCVSP